MADRECDYFERTAPDVRIITPVLETSGRLDVWPAGFFDQHERNFSRLFRLRRSSTGEGDIGVTDRSRPSWFVSNELSVRSRANSYHARHSGMDGMVIAATKIMGGRPVQLARISRPGFGRSDSQSAIRWQAGARQPSPTGQFLMHLGFSGAAEKPPGLTICPPRLLMGSRTLIETSSVWQDTPMSERTSHRQHRNTANQGHDMGQRP